MKFRPLGGALTVMAAAACARAPAAPPRAVAGIGESTSPDVEESAVSDPQIFRVLLRELDGDSVVQRERIHIRVDLGVVTLSGNATCQLAKNRAMETAHVIRGVRAVIDGVTTGPELRSNEELEFTVAGVLSHEPVAAERHLAARANAGVVQLWGDVDSDATRRIIEADLLAIPGVREVADNLGVRPQPVADWRLANEVERILTSDPWLRTSGAKVESHHHVVFLSGSVASAAEWARAEYDARSAAPKRVDLSMLRIETLPDDGTWRETPDRTPTDSDMRQALLDAYVLDPRTQGLMPTVSVQHGVVLLTGVAPDQIALRAAEEDARNVRGALEVRDDIREMETFTRETDDTVLSEVATALARDPRLGALHISVAVTKGRVLLRGTVPTSADRVNAIGVASSVAGARAVQDALVVVPVGLALQ
jgi:osmotically-inducible protein OsmY